MSLWRANGYLRWHAYHVIMRETCELAQNSGVVKASGIDCEKMLGALKTNYADMIRRWMVTPVDQMTYRMDVFKKLTAGVLAMSRDEIQRERLELLREKQADKSESSGSSRASRSLDRRAGISSQSPAPEPPEPPEFTADAPIPVEPHETGALPLHSRNQGSDEAKRVETAGGSPGKAVPPSPELPAPPLQQAPEVPKPIQAPPTQPPVLIASTIPKTPPNRDRRGRYGLL